MHLYFIDDSGTISSPDKITQNYFVLGGLVIPEQQWRVLERAFVKICRSFEVRGEIKWRFFGQKQGREDKDNSLSHLSISERDAFRTTLLTALVNGESTQFIAGVIHLPTVYNSLPNITPEYVHAMSYQTLITEYQSYLNQHSKATNSVVNGIIISDHRNPVQDLALRNLHMNILKPEADDTLKCPNLIESLFFAPSHHSIGIQFADLISGAVFRYFEHNDDRWYRLLQQNFWKSSTQQEETFVKLIDAWEEKDAESIEPFDSTEPTLMTQSQRIPDRNSE